MANNQGSRNRPQASRAGGPSRSGSTMTPVSTWLQQVPSEFSAPSARTTPTAQGGPPSNAASQLMMPPPRGAQQVAPGSTRASEARAVARRDMQSSTQSPVDLQRSIVQQEPARNTQLPVVNNFNYSYSPVDNRRNITTNNNQRHFVDNSRHHNTNTPQQNQTTNSSRRNTITPSMDTAQRMSGSGPSQQQNGEPRGGRAPSESIPLSGPRITKKKGIFFTSTCMTTSIRVRDDRPC